MAAHAHLKNEFMEDEKDHNLMSWLKQDVDLPSGAIQAGAKSLPFSWNENL